MDLLSKTMGRNLFLLVGLLGHMALAEIDKVVEVRPTTAHLKKHTSAHLVIYYPRDFHKEVPELAASAEVFLVELAARWSVILPEQKIPITLGTQEPKGQTWSHFEAPFWMHSHYDHLYRRIELAVTRPLKYDGPIVADALKHHLVHYLLNLKQSNNLPAYLEEGLAQHYGRPKRSRDRYLAIWGCFRQPDLHTFLTDEQTFSSPFSFYSGAALSRLLVAWLWQQHPDGETQFLQSYLRGLPWEDALTGAGFKNMEALFPNFQQDIRPSHQVYFIFLTLDFWIIALGLLAILYMAFKLVAAFRTARTPFVQVGNLVLIEENLPTAEEFIGPAFSAPDAAPATGTATPHRPVARKKIPVSNPFEEIDDDLDAVFNQRDNPFEEIATELDDLFDRIGEGAARETEAQPLTNPSANGTGDLVPEKEAIDEDLDRLFGDWTSKTGRGE